MSDFEHPASSLASDRPKVIVLSLASDFGCQVQLSNFPYLLESLSTIDLAYWQLVISADMPTDYDLAIIEGAVTTTKHLKLLKEVRKTAHTVIALGTCAAMGGIPALAGHGPSPEERLEDCARTVYGDYAARIAQNRIVPRPLTDVISVDYSIVGCPIDPEEFSSVLQYALLGVKERPEREPLCAQCKIIEAPCFYTVQKLAADDACQEENNKLSGLYRGSTDIPCLGLVTRTGCGALCISRGRPCTGCRGIAQDANLESARNFIREQGRSVEEFDRALAIYCSHSMNSAVLNDHSQVSG
ncbi:MAG: NADH:ubiquinone oxidoreductase [Coriobacteriia bacterium]|nr:NADH:ubiquinone oxidoreductase [Coriobacteriia bacterium]MCL2745775.1 NADH:ubiquinone oxidoreductase [Coriobacteriia bacterium]MCL2870272.1 NADH:ubiquinone oxidoreductase [Coriobacteriia bacterium]